MARTAFSGLIADSLGCPIADQGPAGSSPLVTVHPTAQLYHHPQVTPSEQTPTVYPCGPSHNTPPQHKPLGTSPQCDFHHTPWSTDPLSPTLDSHHHHIHSTPPSETHCKPIPMAASPPKPLTTLSIAHAPVGYPCNTHLQQPRHAPHCVHIQPV